MAVFLFQMETVADIKYMEGKMQHNAIPLPHIGY